jgi:hypothetical protein
MLVVLSPAFANNTGSFGPFNSVALAGHTQMGGEACTCGCSECICDPGEPRSPCTNSVSREPKIDPSGDTLPMPESSGDGGAFLFGSLMLMALARFLWR